jgi:antiviral helicase SLH1
VNILLQSFISRYRLEDFALVSDQAYVAQNGGRIVRALLEIALSRKWAGASFVLMKMSKAVEKRMWPFEHPLKQFSLHPEVLYNLETWADDWAVEDLAAMTGDELGKLIHLNEKHGTALLNVAKQLPRVEINYALRPLAQDVLRIAVRVHRSFSWNSKAHGSAEPFWLWVEDSDGSTIKQLSHLLFRPTTEVTDVEFVVSIPTGEAPSSMTIRYVSDRWTGADGELLVSFESLIMPSFAQSRTLRLDLPFLSPSALRNGALQSSLSGLIDGFNAIQTQILWSLMHTKMHSLVSAPVGCGKSVMAQILAL